MTRTQYQSAPTPPPPTLTAIAGNLTANKAGTYYFWLISRCIGGFTLPSNSSVVTVTDGQGIRITIPSTVKPTGAEVLEVVITANTSNDPSTAYAVASFPLYSLQTPITATTEPTDYDTIVITLPAQVDLTEDEHLIFGGTLSTVGLLPTGGDLVHGMKRYVDEVGKILEYNAEIGNELGEPDGWFARYPQTFNPYVTSTTSAGQYGADREIASIVDTSTLIYPKYGLSGTSRPVGMMIVNTESTEIVTGERIMVTAEISGFDASADLVDLINLKPQGILDTQNYILDTADQSDVGATFPYAGLSTVLKVQKDIPQYSAYLFLVEADFTATEVNNNVLNGSTLDIYAKIYPARSSYSADGGALGDFVLKYGEFGRIMPRLGLNPVRGTVTGRVAKYTFEELGQEGVYGLLTNTPDQQIVINNRGTAFASTTIPNSAALRAIASTVNGVGIPSTWEGNLTVDNTKLIEITLDLPLTIRSNYPDAVAGMTAELNSTLVRVYVRPVGGGTITQFDVSITGIQDEVIQVGATSGTSIGTSLPTIDTDFGFFTPSANLVTTATGTSVFSTSTVEIAIAYVYSNTLTAINHDEADLKVIAPTQYITELQLSLAEAIELAQYYSQVQIGGVNQNQRANLNLTGDQWTVTDNILDNSTEVSITSHVGEVTGTNSLSLNKTAITNKTTVTPVSGDFVLISQTSDSGNLKKVDALDFLSGAIADGDKGDITVSSSGTVWTVDNSSITYSKIQNVSATDKLLGRISTGAGVIEEVTCTDFAQSLLDDTDANTARTTLGLGTLSTQSGTFSGISSGTNTGDQNIFSTIAVSGQSNVVADNTNDTLTLVAGNNISITTDASTDTITITASSSGISDGDKGDITVSSLGTVWTVDNQAITYPKIQNISATDRLLGRSSAGAGVIEEITCTSFGRSLIDDTDASTARTTLGLGSLATQSGTFSGTSSGTNTGDQPNFLTIAVAGQNNVVADNTTDTLTLVAGANITITTNDTTDTITIAATGSTGYGTIQDEGTGLTARNTINFIGSLVNAVDNSGSAKTDVTINYSSTEITGKTLVTLAGSDNLLITDASDSYNLKKIVASDFLNLNNLGGDFNVGSYSIVDVNTNELIKFGVTASAVNEITITNNSTGNNPVISATGNDTNIGLTLAGKGTGVITFNSPVYFAKSQDMVVTDMGTGVSIDLSLGNIFKRDAVAGNITFTVSNTTTNYHIFSLLFTYTSGTITWFSGITWDGGSSPTLTASKIYEFTFKTYDGGTNWYGAISFTNG